MLAAMPRRSGRRWSTVCTPSTKPVPVPGGRGQAPARSGVKRRHRLAVDVTEQKAYVVVALRVAQQWVEDPVAEASRSRPGPGRAGPRAPWPDARYRVYPVSAPLDEPVCVQGERRAGRIRTVWSPMSWPSGMPSIAPAWRPACVRARRQAQHRWGMTGGAQVTVGSSGRKRAMTAVAYRSGCRWWRNRCSRVRSWPGCLRRRRRHAARCAAGSSSRRRADRAR